MQSTPFGFAHGQQATIRISDEVGKIIGRAEYKAPAEDSYLLGYVTNDGKAVEARWIGSAPQAELLVNEVPA